MAQWGNNDAASNSAIFATMQVGKEVSVAERNALFGNTTADAYQAGQTIGQYGVSGNEIRTARADGRAKAASPGWALRTEGTGGRAGRVQYETLVAFSHNSMTGDAADDLVLEDFNLSISASPGDGSGSSSGNEQVTFAVVVNTYPTGFTGQAAYSWEYTTTPGDTGTFATADGVSGFSGATGDVLTVDANTVADGTLVRCVVTATGSNDTGTSGNATLTVTA